MFLQASVILLTRRGGPGGCLFWGVSAPRGVGGWSRGRGCLLPGGVWRQGGAWSGRGGVCSGGCLVETPRDGHCCGRYASYWNAFLFLVNLQTIVCNNNNQIISKIQYKLKKAKYRHIMQTTK